MSFILNLIKIFLKIKCFSHQKMTIKIKCRSTKKVDLGQGRSGRPERQRISRADTGVDTTSIHPEFGNLEAPSGRPDWSLGQPSERLVQPRTAFLEAVRPASYPLPTSREVGPRPRNLGSSYCTSLPRQPHGNLEAPSGRLEPRTTF